MDDGPAVREMRLVVTAADYDEAVHFYRDVLGLREVASYSSDAGPVAILDAGRATLELTSTGHAAYIDEVEVGRRVAGHLRVAFQVDDSRATTRRLEAAGATVIAEPTVTPWKSLNARLEAPAGLQLTLVHRARTRLSRSAARATRASRAPGGSSGQLRERVVGRGDR